MNYDEFIHISGESYNDISPDQYKYEIEPAYMNLPDKIVKDKESFCKFWSKNRELCKFISEQHAKIYSLAKQVASASKNAQDLQAQLTDANAIIKNLETRTSRSGVKTTFCACGPHLPRKSSSKKCASRSSKSTKHSKQTPRNLASSNNHTPQGDTEHDRNHHHRRRYRNPGILHRPFYRHACWR